MQAFRSSNKMPKTIWMLFIGVAIAFLLSHSAAEAHKQEGKDVVLDRFLRRGDGEPKVVYGGEERDDKQHTVRLEKGDAFSHGQPHEDGPPISNFKPGGSLDAHDLVADEFHHDQGKRQQIGQEDYAKLVVQDLPQVYLTMQQPDAPRVVAITPAYMHYDFKGVPTSTAEDSRYDYKPSPDQVEKPQYKHYPKTEGAYGSVEDDQNIRFGYVAPPPTVDYIHYPKTEGAYGSVEDDQNVRFGYVAPPPTVDYKHYPFGKGVYREAHEGQVRHGYVAPTQFVKTSLDYPNDYKPRGSVVPPMPGVQSEPKYYPSIKPVADETHEDHADSVALAQFSKPSYPTGAREHNESATAAISQASAKQVVGQPKANLTKPNKSKERVPEKHLSTDSQVNLAFCLRRADGFYRHPTNCSRILQCHGNYVYEHPPCVNGLVFDEVKRACDYRYRVPACAEEPKQNVVSTEPTGHGRRFFPVRANVGVQSTSCTHGDHLSNDNDCSSFFRCVWGRLVPMKCAEGTAFNPRLGVCDHSTLVSGCKGIVA